MNKAIILSFFLLATSLQGRANCLPEYGQAKKDRSAIKAVSAGAGMGLLGAGIGVMGTEGEMSPKFYAIASAAEVVVSATVTGLIFGMDMSHEKARALIEASRIQLGLDPERERPVMLPLLEITDDMTAAQVLEIIRKNKSISNENIQRSKDTKWLDKYLEFRTNLFQKTAEKTGLEENELANKIVELDENLELCDGTLTGKIPSKTKNPGLLLAQYQDIVKYIKADENQ